MRVNNVDKTGSGKPHKKTRSPLNDRPDEAYEAYERCRRRRRIQ